MLGSESGGQFGSIQPLRKSHKVWLDTWPQGPRGRPISMACVALRVAMLLPPARYVRTAHRPLRMLASDSSTAPELLRQIQNGESPEGLAEFLSTTRGARALFGAYLSSDDLTCADAEEPPGALADCLVLSPPSVHDVLLMNLVNGAAAGSERTCSRARRLVDSVWDLVPTLSVSCRALRDVVASKLGEEDSVGWDQNYELAKDEWAGLMAFTTFDTEQLERIRDALATCGSDGIRSE